MNVWITMGGGAEMKITLKQLILFVALLSVGLTMMSLVTWGYQASKESFTEEALETNEAYAQKMSYTTNQFLINTLRVLKYKAEELTDHNDDETILIQKANQFFEEMGAFNAVLIVSADGEVLASSASVQEIMGEVFNEPLEREILEAETPLISKLFITVTNRLVILLSHPIYDNLGNYIGYLGGAIYLTEPNELNEVLGAHFYEDDSTVYVVDDKGTIIYHPDQEKVNQSVDTSFLQKQNGSLQFVNEEGIDTIAGYARVPMANWQVIVERETASVVQPVVEMRRVMVVKTIPFLIVSFLVIIFVANQIAKPLQQLSVYAEMSLEKDVHQDIKAINVWYYEAIQLKKAIVNSFSSFENKVNYFVAQSETDALIGLRNRRFMDYQMDEWEQANLAYSMILLDIDHFKRVNDRYGHSVGDVVLQYLADEMRQVTRVQDVCCRYGGEEFAILLLETEHEDVNKVAERFRKKLEETISPCGEVITISAGIAHYPTCADHKLKVIELADERLYEAKNSGRNRIVHP